ncbi:copper resistance protein B [uncultured Parasphingopyxis sp.]|uniref:copper resistance protein B n=1 Tax=uncultured Parasphingopyxis sp. TaxID=1547918 RepID=UPI002607DFCD|nr:copper resistance protein B [uncultured Parasphingopyxis sp.]
MIRHLLLLASTLIPAPLLAQHEGHDMSGHDGHAMERPADPHAGHAIPMEPAAGSEDAHAGHGSMDHETMDHGSMDHGSMRHEEMDHGAPALPRSGPPPEAFSGPEHAADGLFPPAEMAETRDQLRRNQGGMTTHLFMFDRLEAQITEGEDIYLWDANIWFGGDIDKFWVKSEGEGEFGGSFEEAETQALWSHAIGPYFDLQTGARYDIRNDGPDTAHLVLGVQGVAPYWFEIDAAAFLSDEGDVTARFEAEYDQRLTQRLILQPRFEASLSAQDIPELGIGAGLSNVEAGLRLRYEIAREFAPYVGVEWHRDIGDTADFTRATGGDPDRWVFLAGVRAWF